MAHDKQYKIADYIIRFTQDGSLKWAEMAGGASYQTALGVFFIGLVEETSDKDHVSPVYIVTVLDKNGEVIERFDDEVLDEENSNAGSDLSYFKKLRKTYEIVKRQASGTEKKLDEVLEAFKNLEEIPF